MDGKSGPWKAPLRGFLLRRGSRLRRGSFHQSTQLRRRWSHLILTNPETGVSLTFSTKKLVTQHNDPWFYAKRGEDGHTNPCRGSPRSGNFLYGSVRRSTRLRRPGRRVVRPPSAGGGRVSQHNPEIGVRSPKSQFPPDKSS